MKKPIDEIAGWRLQQENMSTLFPYVFPQIPPRFRRLCGLARALFLLERCLTLAFALGVVATGAAAFFPNDGPLSENVTEPLVILVVCGLLPSVFLIRLLRHTPKFFWRCPCCGLPFPYYAPSARGWNTLRQEDCLSSMRHLRIRYIETGSCPLIVPSVCPGCRRKFFDMEMYEGKQE